jgi:hypothetical protein
VPRAVLCRLLLVVVPSGPGGCAAARCPGAAVRWAGGLTSPAKRRGWQVRCRLGLATGKFAWPGSVKLGYSIGKTRLVRWVGDVWCGRGWPFEVAVEPHNDYYDPGDDRWRDQVATLVADLDAQVDTVRRGRRVEGTKGAADQLIIALGSAGAFQAAVDCLRAWLGRDRDRRIDLRWEENGSPGLTATANALPNRDCQR